MKLGNNTFKVTDEGIQFLLRELPRGDCTSKKTKDLLAGFEKYFGPIPSIPDPSGWDHQLARLLIEDFVEVEKRDPPKWAPWPLSLPPARVRVPVPVLRLPFKVVSIQKEVK